MAGSTTAPIWPIAGRPASIGPTPLPSNSQKCKLIAFTIGRRDHLVTDTSLMARSEPWGPINLRTLILIRWVAIAGQASTILIVHYGLGFTLPLVPALAVVASSALLNLVLIVLRQWAARLGERDAALYLGYDILQLAVLLYLTGGLQNPFAILILAPVTVAATILSRRAVIALSVLAVAAISVLALQHLPLAWRTEPLVFPPELVLGIWIALVLATVFIGAYTWSIAQGARRLRDAMAATQLALAREQRVSAVGALAAAAAHELGSPLATIAVVAKELVRELPGDSPHAEDAALLLSQSERCRRILAELAQQPEEDGGSPYTRLPISALVEAAAAPYRNQGARLKGRSRSSGAAPRSCTGSTTSFKTQSSSPAERSASPFSGRQRPSRSRSTMTGQGFPSTSWDASASPIFRRVPV